MKKSIAKSSFFLGEVESFPKHTVKKYRSMEARLHSFLMSALEAMSR